MVKRSTCPRGQTKISYVRDGKRITYCRTSKRHRSPSKRSVKRKSPIRRQSSKNLRWDGFPYVMGYKIGDEYTNRKGITKVLGYNRHGKRDWLSYDRGLAKGYKKMSRSGKHSEDEQLKSFMIAMLLKKHGDKQNKQWKNLKDVPSNLRSQLEKQAGRLVEGAKRLHPVSRRDFEAHSLSQARGLEEIRKQARESAKRRSQAQLVLDQQRRASQIAKSPKRQSAVTTQGKREIVTNLGSAQQELSTAYRSVRVYGRADPKVQQHIDKLDSDFTELSRQVTRAQQATTANELSQAVDQINQLQSQISLRMAVVKTAGKDNKDLLEATKNMDKAIESADTKVDTAIEKVEIEEGLAGDTEVRSIGTFK